MNSNKKTIQETYDLINQQIKTALSESYSIGFKHGVEDAKEQMEKEQASNAGKILANYRHRKNKL